MTRVFAILPLLALGACAGSPARIAMESPDQLAAEDSIDLCAAYGVNHGQAVLAEIERRGAVRAAFVDAVTSRKVAVGMSACEVLAAWGKPDKTEQTTTARGTTDRWVFDDFSGYPANTVYFRNGIMSALRQR